MPGPLSRRDPRPTLLDCPLAAWDLFVTTGPAIGPPTMWSDGFRPGGAKHRAPAKTGRSSKVVDSRAPTAGGRLRNTARTAASSERFAVAGTIAARSSGRTTMRWAPAPAVTRPPPSVVSSPYQKAARALAPQVCTSSATKCRKAPPSPRKSCPTLTTTTATASRHSTKESARA